MLLQIHPDNPQERLLEQVVTCLKNGGIIIYPTDTIYGIGCDIYNKDAIERICKIKNISPKKANFSFICSDLTHLSKFASQLDNPTYRFLKNNIPGAFTFILDANKEVPKMLKTNKDTVGIRVPDNKICKMLVDMLGNPIMSTSLPQPDHEVETFTDPEIIQERFGHLVDIVIDAGPGNIQSSTVIDLTDGEPEIIREGAGKISA